MARNNPKPGEKIDWINDDDPTKIIAPTVAQKLAGWAFQQLPPDKRFNWLHNLLSNFQIYANAQVQDWIVIDSDSDEGDYATLTAYIADAPAAGDRVLIKEDQTVTVQTVMPSDITIKFLDGARLLCATNIATSVLQTGSDIIIEGVLKIALSQSGTTDKAIEYNGDNVTGKIDVENSSTGTLTTAHSINSGKTGNQIQGLASNTGGGTLTNILVDNSTEDSNNMSIVDDTNSQIARSRGALKILETPRSNRNILINGCFSIFQRGLTFDSTTTPANDDDEYLADRWILLSDGNDIVDVSRDKSDVPVGARSSIVAEVETINKKFGFLEIVKGLNSKDIIGGKASLSFKAKRTGSSIDNIRAAILSWDSTEDVVTSDVVSAWNASGSNPTLVANWTFENTPASLALTTSWQTFTVENIDIDTASAENVAVFIWIDDTDAALTDKLHLTNVQLEKGEISTPFEYLLESDVLSRCQAYFEKSIDKDISPREAASFPNIEGVQRTVASTTTLLINPTVNFKVSKHSTPGVIVISPQSGTVARMGEYDSASVFQNDDAAVAVNINENGFSAQGSPAALTANEYYWFHWIAEVEL